MAEFNVLPEHIAVIMDGNGRWAKKRLLPRTAGHKVGFDRLVDLVTNCNELGIKYLTVYAFSTENLNRESGEVSALFEIAAKGILDYEKRLMAKNCRLRILGDLSLAPQSLADSMRGIQERLSGNTGLTFCIAFCYGGRQDIVNAVKRIIADGVTDIDTESFKKYLYTADIPDPDLIIRTSGEQRISNFLLYQSAYSEYYFTDTYWPDFDLDCLKKALEAYGKRKRRYGR